LHSHTHTHTSVLSQNLLPYTLALGTIFEENCDCDAKLPCVCKVRSLAQHVYAKISPATKEVILRRIQCYWRQDRATDALRVAKHYGIDPTPFLQPVEEENEMRNGSKTTSESDPESRKSKPLRDQVELLIVFPRFIFPGAQQQSLSSSSSPLLSSRWRYPQ
jgi:hypothetical protein